MGNILYNKCIVPNEKDIENLYRDANWEMYTDNLPRLMAALHQSLFVVSAWDEDQLVGLIRVVGDGITILYIQDLVVLNAYKRKGIGSCLVSAVCDEYRSVRQKVLLTDDTPETRGFYESLGFHSCDRGNLVSFVRFE